MSRTNIRKFTEIPNIGKAMERDFKLLELTMPAELIGKDPYQLYEQLMHVTGKYQDPCVLDTFISAVRYMEGAPARKWWEYTAERKRTLAARSK